MNEFHGRAVIPGELSGNALVTHTGFNVLASFRKSLAGDPPPDFCTDQNNKELFGKQLTGQILCLPQVVGSTTAGMIIQMVASMHAEPKALLFSRTAESLAIAGVLLADIWENVKIVTVDGLGDEFLETVKNGDAIEIIADGTVRVY
jgi:predicted aconitase with swiveling domain